MQNLANDAIHPGHIVVTDPLRADTDNDLVADGRERDLGGDPTEPGDAAENKDSDQDGLTDYGEAVLGWNVSVNGGTPYLVRSNPSRPDSDGDGLPDLAEQVIGTDPNKVDTDGDGLSDFDEYADFAQLQGLGDGNPGYVINATASKQYGSDPTRRDTDGDGLNDKQELVTGYSVLVGTEPHPRHILTNPNSSDTDSDGATDFEEATRTDGVADTTPDMAFTAAEFNLWELEVFDASSNIMWHVPLHSVDPLTSSVLITYGDTSQLPSAPVATPLQAGKAYTWQYRTHTTGGILQPWSSLQPLVVQVIQSPACGTVAGLTQPTDATDPDTDDDGTLDGPEIKADPPSCPLIADRSVTISVETLTINSLLNDGRRSISIWADVVLYPDTPRCW